MQNLKKLINILHAFGNRNSILLEKKLSKSQKELSLYKGIYTGAYENELQASTALYQATPKDKRYTLLKARLEEKILNFLLVIDFKKNAYKDEWEPQNRCERWLYQARILLQLGEEHISERLFKKVLRIAKAYEFTFITVESLEPLLELYIQKANINQYQRTKKEFIYFQEILYHEHSARLLHQQAQLKLLTDQVLDIAYLSSIVVALQDLWKQTPSFILFDLYYRLHVRQLGLTGEYEQLLTLTSLSEEFLVDLKINKKRFDYPLNQSLGIYACLRIGQTAHGLSLAQKSYCLFDSSSHIWLSYQESYFLLAMHACDYGLATKLLEQLEDGVRSGIISALITEKCYLYRAYLYWMHSSEKANLILETGTIKQKLSDLHKDKPGYNISILILQFCQYLQLGKKDLLSKKAEIYKKYMERHLESDIFNRERLFFSLILLLIRHDFIYDQVNKKANKLLNRLEQCVLPGGACVSKLEIVPYAHLWKHLMDMLSKSNTKTPIRFK